VCKSFASADLNHKRAAVKQIDFSCTQSKVFLSNFRSFTLERVLFVIHPGLTINPGYLNYKLLTVLSCLGLKR